MNYYQITADIEDDFEELLEDEDDDTNWLLTSTYPSPARTKTNSNLGNPSNQTPHQDTAITSNSTLDQVGSSYPSDSSRTQNGHQNHAQEAVTNQFEPVVMRRHRSQNASGNDASTSNRASFYRFSRLIEGVASYVSGRPLHEENGSFDSYEENNFEQQNPS